MLDTHRFMNNLMRGGVPDRVHHHEGIGEPAPQDASAWGSADGGAHDEPDPPGADVNAWLREGAADVLWRARGRNE